MKTIIRNHFVPLALIAATLGASTAGLAQSIVSVSTFVTVDSGELDEARFHLLRR